jgi:hypothetical protein
MSTEKPERISRHDLKLLIRDQEELITNQADELVARAKVIVDQADELDVLSAAKNGFHESVNRDCLFVEKVFNFLGRKVDIELLRTAILSPEGHNLVFLGKLFSFTSKPVNCGVCLLRYEGGCGKISKTSRVCVQCALSSAFRNLEGAAVCSTCCNLADHISKFKEILELTEGSTKMKPRGMHARKAVSSNGGEVEGAADIFVDGVEVQPLSVGAAAELAVPGGPAAQVEAVSVVVLVVPAVTPDVDIHLADRVTSLVGEDTTPAVTQDEAILAEGDEEADEEFRTARQQPVVTSMKTKKKRQKKQVPQVFQSTKRPRSSS